MDIPRLIVPSDLINVGQDARRLAALNKNGTLTRVRRGVYVRTGEWMELGPADQYGLRARAFQQLTQVPPVFCHISAALLWGLWIVGIPKELHVLTEVATGGRSRNGVRRHIGSLGSAVVQCGPFLLTDKLQTTMDLITRLPFGHAVAVCDSSRRSPAKSGTTNRFLPAGADGGTPEPKWGNDSPQGLPLPVEELEAAADALPTKAARSRALAVIAFSSPLSGSAGESLSRAQMHLLGFPAPELQRAFTLRDGRRALTDFYFRQQQVVGEFDGRGKYLRADWAQGKSLEQRILDEKDREDQIRAHGVGFVRWTWKEMLDRDGFARLLRQAGLPQK